jgi:hypothetical protein
MRFMGGSAAQSNAMKVAQSGGPWWTKWKFRV